MYKKITKRKTSQLLPRMRMHSADYAVARCPSVRLSVTRRYCVKKAKHVIKLLSPSVSHTILVYPCQTLWQYSDGDPRSGAVECRWGMKIAIFNKYLA